MMRVCEDNLVDRCAQLVALALQGECKGIWVGPP